MSDAPAGSGTRGVTGWKATLAIIVAVAALFVVINVLSDERIPERSPQTPPVVTSVTPGSG